MATIELSSGFMTSGQSGGFIPRVITSLDGQTSLVGLIGLYAYNYPSLRIMKGTVPTDFTGLTSSSSRASDVLIQYDKITGELVNSSTANPITINTVYKTPIASGTATWFWLYSGDELKQQMVGTVGTVSSGADMEISSVNIVSGTAYRVINSNFLTIPSVWTY